MQWAEMEGSVSSGSVNLLFINTFSECLLMPWIKEAFVIGALPLLLRWRS